MIYLLLYVLITFAPILISAFVSSELIQFILGCIIMTIVTITLLLLKAGYEVLISGYSYKTIGTVVEVEMEVEDDNPRYKIDYFCDGKPYFIYLMSPCSLGEHIDVFVDIDKPDNGFTSRDFKLYKTICIVVSLWAAVILFLCGDLIMW